MAWQSTVPPERRRLDESKKEINTFVRHNAGWVIEGCYADLLELVTQSANEIISMNLPVDACIANARKRPWEPHKYESPEAQNINLEMLIKWIMQYTERNDACSEIAHRKLYDNFKGKKTLYISRESG